jgi:hypothetical protein
MVHSSGNKNPYPISECERPDFDVPEVPLVSDIVQIQLSVGQLIEVQSQDVTVSELVIAVGKLSRFGYCILHNVVGRKASMVQFKKIILDLVL